MRNIRTLLLSVLILVTVSAYSQTDTVSRKNQKFEDYRFSLKAGYHSEQSYKYDAGLILSGSAAVGFSKYFYLGLNFDFWKNSREISYNNSGTETSTKFGFSVDAYGRIPGSKVSVNIGGGIGSYYFFYNPNTYNSDRKYINFRAFTGVDYKVSNAFYVASEISYNVLLYNMEDGSGFYSIKIGPTFVIR
jgi:hypothetical protein